MWQDGILVMRALREFSYRETNRAFYSIEVTFEAGADPSWKHVAMVNYTNMGILHQFTVCILHSIQLTISLRTVHHWDVILGYAYSLFHLSRRHETLGHVYNVRIIIKICICLALVLVRNC